jgi:hypothetical protein
MGMMVRVCNPSTEEAEAGGLWVWGQPGLHSKTLQVWKYFCWTSYLIDRLAGYSMLIIIFLTYSTTATQWGPQWLLSQLSVKKDMKDLACCAVLIWRRPGLKYPPGQTEVPERGVLRQMTELWVWRELDPWDPQIRGKTAERQAQLTKEARVS